MRTLAAALLIVLACAARVDAACTGSSPNWASTPDQPSLASCVSSAIDGDTITVSAGSATWTTQITIPSTKGLTIRGAGIGLTTITWEGVEGAFHVNLGTEARAVVDISGFTIDLNLSTASVNRGFEIDATATNANAFRIHHNEVKDVRLRGIVTYNAGFAVSGVIDNNIVRCPSAGSCHYVEVLGASPNPEATASVPFSRGLSLGSSDAIFIEDNTFDGGAINDGVIDAYDGAKFVARFNTITHDRISWHGVDSSLRGIHSFEVYRNSYSNDLTEIAGSEERSGVGMFWQNTFIGNYTAQLLKVARAGDSGTAQANQCDGLQAKDGNEGVTGVPGWPCLDQTGTLFNEPRDGTHTHYGNYYWQNTNDGVYFGAIVGFDPDSVIEGRDFRNGTAGPQTTPTSPFNGTSGIGWGTLSNRPTTCTGTSGHTVIGVGYWATDQGSWNTESAAQHAGHAANHAQGEDGVFYKCTSTNTWTAYYTPYTYPHPLVGGGSTGPVTYYVDNSCANNGNGTLHTCAGSPGGNGAWNTLASARGIGANTCAAGDTVKVKAGSGPYISTNNGSDPSEDGGFFISCAAATSGSPYTLTAYDTANPPTIANCALGSTTWAACDNATITKTTADYVTVSYLKIFGGIWFTGPATTVEANLIRGNTISHNEIYQGWGEVNDGNWSAIFLAGCYGAQVDNNYIHDINITTGGGSQSSMAGIKMFTCTNSTYELNTVDNVTGVSNQTGCIDDKQDSRNNTIRYNWCTRVPHGVRIQNQTNVTFPYNTTATGTVVEYNVFSATGATGTTPGDCLRLETGGITSLVFRQNTCVGPYQGDAALHAANNPTGPGAITTGIRAYNNIVMGDVKHVQFYSTATFITFDQLDYNVWDSAISNAFTFGGGNFSTLTDVVNTTPFEDHGQAITQAAVQFTNAATYDYRLGATSPARNTCTAGGVFGGAATHCGAYTVDVTCIGATGGTGFPTPPGCGGGGGGDITAPAVTITAPTSASTYSSSVTGPVTISGTASDAVGVTSCTCAVSRGPACSVSGTATWIVPNYAVLHGSTTVTITCFDAAANQGTDSLVITYTPPVNRHFRGH